MKINATFERFCLFCGILIIGAGTTYAQQNNTVIPGITLPHPEEVKLTGGILSEAVDVGCKGRIVTLPETENEWFFKIYSRDSVAENSPVVQARKGTYWQGEHTGKWMIAAARAANRTKDKKIEKLLKENAAYLMSQQDENGYMGTYIPSVRFYSDEREDFGVEWDIWNNSYNLLGFLEANKYYPNPKYLSAAQKIGNLLYKTFYKTGKSVAYHGNHYGLSGIVLIEAIVDLYTATGDQKYLGFAEEIILQIEARPELQVVSKTNAGTDLQKIGDGKIYQLLWTYTGIAKLHKATGNPDYLKACEMAWENIVEQHLTPTGGPWGGIGINKELFNEKWFFSPYGIIETCNIMSWIHLNRELLSITGEVRYAEALEKTFYNALLGAQYFDGEQWGYFSMVNGMRSVADYHDCCRSSGMISLEEIAPIIYGVRNNGIAVNIYTPSEAQLEVATGEKVTISQSTTYPVDDKITIRLTGNKKLEYPLQLRIPDWAVDATIHVNGKALENKPEPGTYAVVHQKWQKENTIEITFPMEYKVETKNMHAQMRKDYLYTLDFLSVSRGPLVFATSGLINGKQREDALEINLTQPDTFIKEVNTPNGFNGPAIEIVRKKEPPILMLPFYEAGGIEPDTWRLTWLHYWKGE